MTGAVAAGAGGEVIEKVLLVTRRTRLEDLIARFNTRSQARFYIEHSGGDFGVYQAEHDAYLAALDVVRKQLDLGLPVQRVDRSLLTGYLPSGSELVVTLGQDGLVANTAKYVPGRPVLAVNPDPERIDGILLPHAPGGVRRVAGAVIEGRATERAVTMAEARLDDGQRLLAFNDLYLGARTHVSARYRLSYRGRAENQSSSGLLISTGAGSTGWLSSVFQMARGVARLTGGTAGAGVELAWEAPRLVFVTREPFVSRHSSADLTAGLVEESESLEVESRMPSGGVIFSDGIESDFLSFDSGRTAVLGVAPERARLVIGAGVAGGAAPATRATPATRETTRIPRVNLL